MKLLKLSIVSQTLAVLLLTEAVAVASLFFLQKEPQDFTSVPGLTLAEFIIIFFFATALLLLLIRFLKGRFFFEFIFSLAIFGGLWFLAILVLPLDLAVIVASGLTLARIFIPLVFVQNFVMIFGIAGVASAIGAPTPWQTILAILLILSIYDIIAVYETKHMVTMFKGLLERGVIFALILPERFRLQFSHLREVKPGEGFFFLGTGDLALPTMFVVSAFVADSILGVGAALGSIAGLVLTDLIFAWGRRRPMPALPPIALGTIVGFTLAFIFK